MDGCGDGKHKKWGRQTFYLVANSGNRVTLKYGTTWIGRASFPIPPQFQSKCSRKQASMEIKLIQQNGEELVKVSLMCHGLNPIRVKCEGGCEEEAKDLEGETGGSWNSFFTALLIQILYFCLICFAKAYISTILDLNCQLLLLPQGRSVDLNAGDSFFLAPGCLLTLRSEEIKDLDCLKGKHKGSTDGDAEANFRVISGMGGSCAANPIDCDLQREGVEEKGVARMAGDYSSLSGQIGRFGDEFRPITGMENVVLSSTGYRGEAKEKVMEMAELCGAKYCREFDSKRGTHLICWTFQGAKFELAQKKSHVTILNHTWLRDCVRANRKLLEDPYTYHCGMEADPSFNPTPSPALKSTMVNSEELEGKRRGNRLENAQLNPDCQENGKGKFWNSGQENPKPSTQSESREREMPGGAVLLDLSDDSAEKGDAPSNRGNVRVSKARETGGNPAPPGVRPTLAERMRASQQRRQRERAEEELARQEGRHGPIRRRQVAALSLPRASTRGGASRKLPWRGRGRFGGCSQIPAFFEAFGGKEWREEAVPLPAEHEREEGSEAAVGPEEGSRKFPSTNGDGPFVFFPSRKRLREEEDKIEEDCGAEGREGSRGLEASPAGVGCACAICREESVSGVLGSVGCGHAFCFGCIWQWADLTATSCALCPLCKAPFDRITQKDKNKETLISVRRTRLADGALKRRLLSVLERIRNEGIDKGSSKVCSGCGFGAPLLSSQNASSAKEEKQPWLCSTCTKSLHRLQNSHHWQSLFGPLSEMNRVDSFSPFLIQPLDPSSPMEAQFLDIMNPSSGTSILSSSIAPREWQTSPVRPIDFASVARMMNSSVGEEDGTNSEASGSREARSTLSMFARLQGVKEFEITS